VSATSVTATVPKRSVTGKISIVTPQGTATSASDFTVERGSADDYGGLPTSGQVEQASH